MHIHIYAYTYIYICVHAVAIIGKRGHEFNSKWEEVHGRV